MLKIKNFKSDFVLIGLILIVTCNPDNKKTSSSVVIKKNEIIAFPGAEGAGKYAVGGRGGDVYCVTNLNDSGKVSITDSIEPITKPLNIFFDVAETIRLKSNLEIRNVSNLTIAGQTAPGEGIIIADYTVKIHDSKQVVVLYLRDRLDDENKPPNSWLDCIEINYDEDFISDHLSLSWGIDLNGDFRRLKNLTNHWCIFSEALNNSIQEKGEHGLCKSFRQSKGLATFHHNIYASSRNRHPSIGSGSDITEFCNNVDYNWHTSNDIDGVQIIIDSQREVGGCDFYESINRPPNWDTDNDRFTNLEEYLNSLVLI